MNSSRKRLSAAPLNLMNITMSALILVWLAGALWRGGAETAPFNGPEGDGIFQFYNALRRIAAGQRPGIDFQVFHGIGIPYFHYPLFVLLGGSFRVAEWLRVGVSALVHPTVVLVFVLAYCRRWTPALGLTVVVLVASRWMPMLYNPSNSMLSIRAFAPVLVASAMMARVTDAKRALLVGSLLGGSLLLGVEQGVAALVAFLVSGFLARAAEHRLTRYLTMGASALAALLTAFAAMLTVGGVSGTASMLRYNLRDLPGDQTWYFGAPPVQFIAEWHDFGRIPFVIAGFFVAFAMVIAIWRRGRRDGRPTSRRSTAVSMLLLYGMLSCGSYAAIIAGHYAFPLGRSLLLSVLALAYAHVRRERGHARWLAAPRARMLLATAMVAALVGCAVVIGARVQAIAAYAHQPLLSARLDHDLRVEDSLLTHVTGGHPERGRVWSVYAGLFDATRGRFQPAPDYMIHALGTRGRDQYLRDFDRWQADVVQTEFPPAFYFEEWLQVSRWPFYERLLRGYTIATITSKRMLWRRLPEISPRTASHSVEVVADAGGNFTLPEPTAADDSSARSIQVVDIEYDAINPWRAVPVLGGMTRFFVDVAGARNLLPVSLPPRGTTFSFPVYRDGRGRARLTARNASLLPSSRLNIRRVVVHEWVLTGLDAQLVPVIRTN